MSLRKQILDKLESLTGNESNGHDLEHFIIVADHSVNALKHENLSSQKKSEVELAALLHDADDKKIFPNSKNYQNAQNILNEFLDIPDKNSFIDEVIEMIDLVSCSKNGGKKSREPWMTIPRDCDRLDAIGQRGIDRVIKYNTHKGHPMHLDDTPRVYSEEELWKVATHERFVGYTNGVPSKSMIDHFYDKLLHIGKPEHLESKNPYVLEEAAKRTQIMVDFVLNYWKSH